jgi:cellulose synthase/poly-beta-1,6-N-acetylglucosamine synthase-like glycosyltransferase
MMIWLVGIVGLLIIQYLLLLLFLITGWKDHLIKTEELPKVSVLIAARNEEKELPKLLGSLERLNYPIEKLEILIGDDQSTDQTAVIIETWAREESNRKRISVESDSNDGIQRNGKANALAVLCEKASGDFLFFTDADCEVPQNWILEGINCFGQEVGLVLGITQVKSRGWFEKMQEIDWWNTLGIVKIVTDLKLPSTGLGNNMVISRPAYMASGGFEKIPFSLTEDLEISKAIRKVGYSIRHQVSENFLVKTKAEKGLNALLQQRKRWMAGAMTLSSAWKILLGLQFLFFPAVLVLIALDWQFGLILFGSKIIIQSLFLVYFSKKAGQKIGTIPLLLFDFYQIGNLSLTILYYFWSGQTEWKSRKYA